MNWFTRYGSEVKERVTPGQKAGHGTYIEREKCRRCGGAGGWKGWPGYTCFDCGGSGQALPRERPCYSADVLAQLNSQAEKRHARAAAKAQAKADEERAKFQEWLAPRQWAVTQAQLHGEGRAHERLLAELERERIFPEWIIDSAIMSALRAFARRDEAAASEFVGKPGERVTLTLTCEKLMSFPAQWPATTYYVCLMRDEKRNRIVYRGGSPALREGATGTFKCTVKEHETRAGEAQTIVQRLKEAA